MDIHKAKSDAELKFLLAILKEYMPDESTFFFKSELPDFVPAPTPHYIPNPKPA